MKNLANESGYYHGELIEWSADLAPKCTLFVGEDTKTTFYLKEKINAKEVITAGLSDVDYVWNFEQELSDIDNGTGTGKCRWRAQLHRNRMMLV